MIFPLQNDRNPQLRACSLMTEQFCHAFIAHCSFKLLDQVEQHWFKMHHIASNWLKLDKIGSYVNCKVQIHFIPCALVQFRLRWHIKCHFHNFLDCGFCCFHFCLGRSMRCFGPGREKKSIRL